MLGALKLFNGLCSHYPVSVFSPCLLRVPPNGGTNRFIWDRNYSIFKQWAHHQFAKEGRVNLIWYCCIYHQDMSKGKREQTNQTVSDYPTSLSIICLHYGLASCFYLLPVWLVTDGVFGGVPRQSFQTLILLSELPVQAQFPPPSMNRSRWLPKNANLIETLHATERFHLHISDIKRQGIELRNSLLLVNEGKEANSREPEWHCSLTAFSNAFVISTFKHGVMLSKTVQSSQNYRNLL